MLCHFDGKYRSTRETNFLELLQEELQNFQSICSRHSVLVFPPLAPQYRFLIHKWVEAVPKLDSVSIGQGRQRRTCVYFITGRESKKMASSPQANPRTFAGRGRGRSRSKDMSPEATLEGEKTKDHSTRRSKRPDRAIYIPGALRKKRQSQGKDKIEQTVESASSNSVNMDAELETTRKNETKRDDECDQLVVKNCQSKHKLYDNVQEPDRSHSDVKLNTCGGVTCRKQEYSSSDVTTGNVPASAEEGCWSESQEPRSELRVSGEGKHTLSNLLSEQEDLNKSERLAQLTIVQHNRNMSPSKSSMEGDSQSCKELQSDLRTLSECEHSSSVYEGEVLSSGELKEKGLSNKNKEVGSKPSATSDITNSQSLSEDIADSLDIPVENDVVLTTDHRNVDDKNMADASENASINQSQECTVQHTNQKTRIETSKLACGEEVPDSFQRNDTECFETLKPDNNDVGERTDENLFIAAERDACLEDDAQKDSTQLTFEEYLDTAAASVKESDSLKSSENNVSSNSREEVISERLEAKEDPTSVDCGSGADATCMPSVCKGTDTYNSGGNIKLGNSGTISEPSLPCINVVNEQSNMASVSLSSNVEEVSEHKKPGMEEDLQSHCNSIATGLLCSKVVSEISEPLATVTGAAMESESHLKELPSQCSSVPCNDSIAHESHSMEEPNKYVAAVDCLSNTRTALKNPDENDSCCGCASDEIDGSGQLEVKSDCSSVDRGHKSEEKSESVVQNDKEDREGCDVSKKVEKETLDDSVQNESGKSSRKKKGKKEGDKSSKVKSKSKEKGDKKKKKEKKKTTDGDGQGEDLIDNHAKEIKLSKKKQCSAVEKEEEETSSKDGSREKTKSVHGRRGPVLCGSDNDDDNWESNFDETGECINPDLLAELSTVTGIETPDVQKTQYDYYSFPKPSEIELDDEEFGHIVEIYNFSGDLTTQELMQALCSYRDKGFDIKWVDDTHALGIFSSRIAAQEAIRLCSSPLMKLRPVSEGTLESKKKASHCFEYLQPYKERPQTSKLLADRLVMGALGLRSKMTREERVKEKGKIMEAKDKKRQEKLQKAQIWGD